jgi:hypothetical protein
MALPIDVETKADAPAKSEAKAPNVAPFAPVQAAE